MPSFTSLHVLSSQYCCGVGAGVPPGFVHSHSASDVPYEAKS